MKNENTEPSVEPSPSEVPLRILEEMKADSTMKEILESSSGSWEGYTIGEHTLMVMTQFEKYFSQRPLPSSFNKDAFLKILLVHDFGKAKAVAEGDKNKQHEYNLELCPEVLKKQGLTEEEINVARALLSGDALGQYIGSRNKNIEETIAEIQKASKVSSMDINDFLDLLMVYYQCDAGAYTKDATIEGIVEGKESIDRYFDFDPQQGQMKFSPTVAEKIALLKERIKAT